MFSSSLSWMGKLYRRVEHICRKHSFYKKSINIRKLFVFKNLEAIFINSSLLKSLSTLSFNSSEPVLDFGVAREVIFLTEDFINRPEV